jgi:hypothetical protein
MTRLLLLACIAFTSLSSAGCGVIVRGTPLSPRPHDGAGIYLSTGGAPGAYRTLGFTQIRAQGAVVAGLLEGGPAVFDGVIKGSLAETAAKMGGNGVIHIEFVDENPPTPVERAMAFVTSIGNILDGGNAETQSRYVTVTGEVVQLLERTR